MPRPQSQRSAQLRKTSAHEEASPAVSTRDIASSTRDLAETAVQIAADGETSPRVLGKLDESMRKPVSASPRETSPRLAVPSKILRDEVSESPRLSVPSKLPRDEAGARRTVLAARN